MNVQAQSPKSQVVSANLTRKARCVNTTALKCSLAAMSIVASAFALAPQPAFAQDAKELALENSTHLVTLLHAVMPPQLPTLLENVANGTVQRIAPNQPVWIMETIHQSILYYQGQPAFAGKQASQLVDDEGVRFGLQAIESAKRSKSRWVYLTLGGQKYHAYCASQYPLVVCSLAI